MSRSHHGESRSHHHGFMGRLAASLAVTVATVVVSVTPARAVDVGFLFLIEKGLAFAAPLVDSQGLAAFVAGGTMRPVVNGQADFTQNLGTANVVVWSRTVPDPFFDPIGPIAALVTLNLLQPLKAHLGLIQTPAGFRTTIGVLQRVGFGYGPLPSDRGEWVISNGIPAGGNVDDLIIGGVVVIGTAVPLDPTYLGLTQFFPTVPFAAGADPWGYSCPSPPGPASSSCLGSFYGGADLGGPTVGPARTYTYSTPTLSGDGQMSHLLTVNLGGDAYAVVACSGLAIGDSFVDCTLSGTGQFAGALAGGPIGTGPSLYISPYFPGQSVGTFKLPLVPFLVLP